MSETGDRTQPIEGQPDEHAQPSVPPMSRASREGSAIDRTMPLPRPASGALPKVPGVDVTRKIGEGGMGVVYVGVQSFLGRQVAVKFLGPEHQGGAFAAHFHREARLLAEMKHTNIVACYQADFTPDGDCYLVMEYIDGPNLRQWIGDRGALSLRTALVLCRDLAQALQHAFEVGVAHHGSGIIHRDVKTDNVLLARNTKAASDDVFPFVVKLADLGLARPSSRGPEQVNLTQHGASVGTPATMAPEQYDDPENVDFRADIYGLGCVLYHALTAQPAFQGATVSAILSQKLAPFGPDPRKHVPALPKAVSGLVSRMLARDRALRPASYAELNAELDRLIESPATEAGSRRRIGLVLGAAACAVLLLCAVWFARERGTAAPPPGPEPIVVDVAPRPAPSPELHDPDRPSEPEKHEKEPVAPVAPAAKQRLAIAASTTPRTAREGARIELQATSEGALPAEVAYTWRQIGDEGRVTLEGADRAVASFVAPQAESDYVLLFEVKASSSGEETLAQVEVAISARNEPPRAEIAPAPRDVQPGDEVVLAGTGIDPEGRPDLEYMWHAPDQTPAIRLEESSGRQARFEAPDFDGSYDARVSLVVRDQQSSSEPAEVIVPVRLDPALDPLAKEQQLELFPSEGGGFSRRWSKEDPEDTFSLSEDHVVRATALVDAPQALCRKSFELPRGPWSLSGTLWLDELGKHQPEEAGILLEISSRVAVQLRLVRIQRKLHVEISRQNRLGKGEPWTLDSVIASDEESWSFKDSLAFEAVWDGRELKIGRRVVRFEEADPAVESRTEAVSSARPRLLTLFVRGRQAFFKNFVLEGPS